MVKTRTKKCIMCQKSTALAFIPTALSVQMPYIKGTAVATFVLTFSKKGHVCDDCLEPVMESAMSIIHNKVCPHMIDLSIHADLLKVAWPKPKKVKRNVQT
jgi:hypothetical protein